MRYNIYSAHSGAFLCVCTDREVYLFQHRHCIVARLVGGDMVTARTLVLS